MTLDDEKLEEYSEGMRKFYEALPPNAARSETLGHLNRANEAAHRSLEEGKRDEKRMAG